MDNVDESFAKGGVSGSFVICMDEGEEALVALLWGEILSPSGTAGIVTDIHVVMVDIIEKTDIEQLELP